MASENVDDWEAPLPTSSTVDETEEEEKVPSDVAECSRNLKKLQSYVNRMVYRPVEPPTAKERVEKLAKPKKTTVVDNYKIFGKVQTPTQRKARMKRMAGKYTAISAEQLEQIIKKHRAKDRKKDDLIKRKQEIFYEMLTKLEQQCREQYLNVLIKKFGSFVAKLATNMNIPPQLVEPYSRMQRGIFCNILLAMGVQPNSQAAIFYNNEEALEYEVCHKLAHAMLSLIIKALDSASLRDPAEVKTVPDTDFDMDNYIKDRLMCAAEKKLLNTRLVTKPQPNPLAAVLKKCKNA